jgi:WD40 repeat protein
VGCLHPLKPSFHLYVFNFRKLTLHSLRTIDWNPLGTLIATGATDRTLRVWNPDRPNIRYSTELKGHEAPIEKVAFNPVKDTELCSLSNDGVLKVWDVRAKTCVNEIKGLGEAFTLQWHPDGESIIVGNKVCLTQSGAVVTRCIVELQIHQDAPRCAKMLAIPTSPLSSLERLSHEFGRLPFRGGSDYPQNELRYFTIESK